MDTRTLVRFASAAPAKARTDVTATRAASVRMGLHRTYTAVGRRVPFAEEIGPPAAKMSPMRRGSAAPSPRRQWRRMGALVLASAACLVATGAVTAAPEARAGVFTGYGFESCNAPSL